MLDPIKKIFNGWKDEIKVAHKAKILVVEDSEVDRKIIVQALEKNNHCVLTAVNGTEGLSTALRERPDLIVLDCEMPEMGGLEMCRRLKEDTQAGNIPVLFLTGLDTSTNILDCFEAEAENFLSKPVNPTVLNAQIKSILEESEAK